MQEYSKNLKSINSIEFFSKFDASPKRFGKKGGGAPAPAPEPTVAAPTTTVQLPDTVQSSSTKGDSGYTTKKRKTGFSSTLLTKQGTVNTDNVTKRTLLGG